ncbi:unnamed protein product [Staurois parvus]|uniref:Uncharacterized protein n=1 Tax=Staurois parvus TaxID=386267 RepID=A0ABN9BD23_9NEOB|nr:unnamed protein product [Staurois parvus]
MCVFVVCSRCWGSSFKPRPVPVYGFRILLPVHPPPSAPCASVVCSRC